MSRRANQTQRQNDPCAIESMFAPAPQPLARWSRGAALLAAALALTPPAALALPFDPVPSAFQRWLNAKKDWPNSEQRRFEKLAECSDQTAENSPYRMAVFTCLAGSVTIKRPAHATQRCAIQRVSYFPTNQRVRVWTGSCRSEAP